MLWFLHAFAFWMKKTKSVCIYLYLNSCLVSSLQYCLDNSSLNFVGGRRDQVVRSSITAQDIHHCYACSDRIKHPDGSCYKAGHVVDMLCYHYN